MTERSLLQSIVGEGVNLARFTREGLADPTTCKSVVADLGGDESKASPQEVDNEEPLMMHANYLEEKDPPVQTSIERLRDLALVFEQLEATTEIWREEGVWDTEGALQGANMLVELMATNYVRIEYPRWFLFLQLVALINELGATYGDGNHNSFLRLGDCFATIGKFFYEPGKSLRNLESGDGPEAERDHAALITDLVVRLGAATAAFLDRDPEHDIKMLSDVHTGWESEFIDPASAERPSNADMISARMTSAAFNLGNGLNKKRLKVTTAMIPKTEDGTAFFMSIGGSWEAEGPINKIWDVRGKIESTGAFGLLLGSMNEIIPPGEGEAFNLEIGVKSHPPAPEPGETAATTSFSFPSATGTRFEVGAAGLGLTVSPTGAELLLSLEQAALVIDTRDCDGFMGELLSGAPLRLAFDLTLGPSSTRGTVRDVRLQFPGQQAPSGPAAGAGANFSIPVGRTVGPVTVHEVGVRVGAGPTGAEPAKQTQTIVEVDASFSATIGPVYLRVDQLGLKVTADRAAKSRNLGIIDLGLGIKFPRGIAINVETALIAGGGAIIHDPVQGVYFGTLDLAVRGGTMIKAIGLIGTKMPDGSKGFSFLIIVTVEFAQPYALGMGFFLQGVGGMLALHRTFDEKAMRAALPTGQLRHVLFPTDPVHNAGEVMRAIQTLFPARRGSYLIGALVKIVWAQPALIHMDLGVIFEWGKQERLILLGRVSALLPRPQEALLSLNMDSVGILDFNAGTFALDAVLYDSKICDRFVLTGAMAMRMAFKDSAAFALAIGGLHPRFAAPAGFPTLNRLQLALSDGDNPKLICQSYFAITSNTVQFGSECSLYASALGFSLSGNVGFDVLIQLAPFHFLAEFRASVQLKRGSRNLFKVSVKGELEGPLPLRIAGKASFEILLCDFTVSFNKTLVSGRVRDEAPAVDILSVLNAALQSPQSWSARPPADAEQLVTLQAGTAAGVLLHPLGVLSVRQKVVPLGLGEDIDHISSAAPTGERRFTITAARLGDQDVALDTSTRVEDQFAPAQFFDLSDDEKLAAPSFELMQAGVTLSDDGYSANLAASTSSKFQYDEIIIDENGNAVDLPEKHEPAEVDIFVMTHLSPAALAAVRRTMTRRFAAAVRPGAPIHNTARFALIDSDTPEQPAAANDRGLLWIEARGRKRSAMGRRSIVGDWELVG